MVAGISSFGTPYVPESQAEKDLRLWKTWKSANGMAKASALTELMQAMQGPIGAAVNSFQGAPMPQVTLKLQAQSYAVDALKDYDQSRGMSLSSYVLTIVKQKLFRYVGMYQNVARIPEEKIRMIGPIREATADLTSKFGHEPSAAQVADHLGVPLSHVTEIRRLLRKDLLEEGGGIEGLEVFEHDPDFEKAMLAYYGMAEVERLVFDHSLGAHGQKQLGTNEIAAKLKISAGRVSQIKKMIAEKIKPYLGNI
jgi:DNA-directed RNA polymerase specialized sigma subunit